jgi:hypothetical protein
MFLFNRVNPVVVSYKEVVPVHIVQLNFIVPNSQSRQRDSVVVSEHTARVCDYFISHVKRTGVTQNK